MECIFFRMLPYNNVYITVRIRCKWKSRLMFVFINICMPKIHRQSPTEYNWHMNALAMIWIFHKLQCPVKASNCTNNVSLIECNIYFTWQENILKELLETEATKHFKFLLNLLEANDGGNGFYVGNRVRLFPSWKCAYVIYISLPMVVKKNVIFDEMHFSIHIKQHLIVNCLCRLRLVPSFTQVNFFCSLNNILAY